jgi:hypothetical protein
MISFEEPSARSKKLTPSASNKKKSLGGGGGGLFEEIAPEFKQRRLPRIISDYGSLYARTMPLDSVNAVMPRPL